MSSKTSLETLKRNAEVAEKTVVELKNELNTLTDKYNNLLAQQLREENRQLTLAVEEAKKKLIQLEVQNGVQQIPLPKQQVNVTLADIPVTEETKQLSTRQVTARSEVIPKKEQKVREVKDEQKPSVELPVDVGRLDLRIGHIEHVQKHPEADTLYVSKVNCGEKTPRTVCSGLVKFFPLEALEKRYVVVLCNLKPVKMRGITSEAMVLCVNSPDAVEILLPPEGCQAGDLVYCDGFNRNPDPIMNPKKKIFETVAPYLSTNDALEACYKGVPLKVPGKGSILATTLKNCPIK